MERLGGDHGGGVYDDWNKRERERERERERGGRVMQVKK